MDKIKNLIDILLKTNIPFELRRELGGYNVGRSDDYDSIFLVFCWEHTYRSMYSSKDVKYNLDPIMKSISGKYGDSHIHDGHGFLYFANKSYSGLWDYCQYSVIYTPKGKTESRDFFEGLIKLISKIKKDKSEVEYSNSSDLSKLNDIDQSTPLYEAFKESLEQKNRGKLIEFDLKSNELIDNYLSKTPESVLIELNKKLTYWV